MPPCQVHQLALSDGLNVRDDGRQAEHKPIRRTTPRHAVAHSAPVGEVLNRGRDPLYRLARLGDGGGHALVRAAENAEMSAPKVLPAGMPEADYLSAFENAVGGFRSVQLYGVRTRIDDELFREESGALKLFKRGRERYVEHLAQTILAPDEVFEAAEPWRSQPGRERTMRRFLKTFGEGPEAVRAVVVFRLVESEAQFVGTTAFIPINGRGEIDAAYFEKQRTGVKIK